MQEHQLTSAASALQFIQGGKAIFTLRSAKTGARFTYRVRASQDAKVFFVGALSGPDNERSYAYFGYIREGVFVPGGRKARLAPDAPAVRAFTWAYADIRKGRLHPALQVWHAGRCARCARTLTVPESIASGIGPECASRMGAARVGASVARVSGRKSAAQLMSELACVAV